jgi:hypothetical protein
VNLNPRYGHGKPPHPELFSIINSNRGIYKDFLLKALDYKDEISAIKDLKVELDPQQPVWNNGYLPGLDIIGLYTMLCECKPNKYLEVGSGNSTKVAYKAKCDKDLETEIICIDPNPRVEVDSIANKVFKQQFESVNFDIIGELNAGDMLFIDNSHRIFPNSDSMVFFLEVLPRLKKGVIVHIHDIYLPYDYPQFMCDRFYSEQYGIAMYLLANPEKYEPILPNYFISCDKELSDILLPFWQLPNLAGVEKHGGSFWLRIN